MKRSTRFLFLTLALFSGIVPVQAAPVIQKERLVLMPLRLAEDDRTLQGVMEAALVEGLQAKYKVYSGEEVAQKAKAIFDKESKTTKKDCDETRCMEDIGMAFNAELIATASVQKQSDGYFLALKIQDIMDNTVVYSKSTPCKNCDAYEVVDKLKELVGGASASPAAAVKSDQANSNNDNETELWKTIESNPSLDDYQAYLEAYPAGKYVVLAKTRIKKMQKVNQAQAEVKDKNVVSKPEVKNQVGTAKASDTTEYPIASYAMGINIAINIKQMAGFNVKLSQIEQGIRDGMSGAKSKYTSEDIKTAMDGFGEAAKVKNYATVDGAVASYGIGLNIAKNLKQMEEQASELAVDVDMVIQGFKDKMTDAKLKYAQDVMDKSMQDFSAKAKVKQEELKQAHDTDMKTMGEKNIADGKTFLASNANKEGVITTKSGLQYKILTRGDGPKPRPTDTVTVNYRGTLIDGKEFDSSYKRGEPATFAVNAVIPGWTEVLQLMREGAKWEVVIPSDLAYGPGGAGGDIGPNAVLVFEIELLKARHE